VRDYQFYVTDDRYDVPSLMFVTVRDPCRAHRIAERILHEPHHHAVEVWERERQLFTLSEAARQGAEP
jgi:hypothetical protein